MKINPKENYLKKELYDLIKIDSTLFDFIQEGSLDGIWYWNLEAIEDEWLSPKFWTVLGYDPKEKTHSSSEWQDIIFEDDLIKAKMNFEKHIKDSKHPYDQEVRYRHKNGSTVWIRCRGIAIRDENGKAIRMLGAHTDITDLKQKEAYSIESEQRFRIILQNLGDGVVIHSSDSTIIDCNNRALEIMGMSKDQLLGKTGLDPIWKFVNEDEKTLSKEEYPINLVLADKKPIHHLIIGVVSAANKEITWVQVKGTPIFDYQGNVREVVITFFDISKLKSEKKLLENEQRDLLLSQKIAKLGTWRLNIKTNEVTWSEELYKMYGFDPTQPVPPYTEHMKLFTKESWSKLSSALSLTRTQGIPYELELEMALKGGSKGWMWVRGEAEYDNQGQIVSLTGAAQDITKQKKVEEEIIYAANHDYLTNLYNRRYLVNAFESFIATNSTSLGLMMMDINGLKIINDAFGHVQGDMAIKCVSNLLMKVVGPEDIVARIGGDEFAILTTNKNAQQLQEYKDKIITLSNDIKIDNIQVSLAIGHEILTESDKNIDDLLSRAEKHLYVHKITVGESIRNNVIKAILNTLTDKYEEEKIHSIRVSEYCKKIGTELGLNNEEVDVLGLAGMYHDIGKISIPDAILHKPGKLTDEEYEIIKTHTQIGYQILRAADEYSGLAEYAMSHHERWDGKGYPKGLTGINIPLFSRIINVADSFETMTSNRPYHKAMRFEDAVLEIKRYSGSQFDPEIANTFLKKVLKHQQ